MEKIEKEQQNQSTAASRGQSAATAQDSPTDISRRPFFCRHPSFGDGEWDRGNVPKCLSQCHSSSSELRHGRAEPSPLQGKLLSSKQPPVQLQLTLHCPGRERWRGEGGTKIKQKKKKQTTLHENFTTYSLNNSATRSVHQGKEGSRVGGTVPNSPQGDSGCHVKVQITSAIT